MAKHILITGSTDGIGKLAAIKLAQEGHNIYVHGRKTEKLNAVIAEIKSLSANENIKGFTADFSDLSAVKQMASAVNSEMPQIDVLINNAGVFKSANALNKDGLDLRYVVNYLAPYVLTNALLSLVKKGNEPRIINLSSAAQSPVSLEVLSGKSSQSENATYAQSKLALTMWSFDLAKREKDLAVIAVNPGSLLNTNMVKEAYGKFWSSADKGASILHDLAVSEDYKGVTGKYFDNDQGSFGHAHADAYNQSAIEELIKHTNEILVGK